MIAAGSVTATGVVVTVQLLASLTVTVYGDPAAFTVKVFPAWKAPPLSEYCNGAVPPDAVTVNVVVPPLQAIVPADADAEITAGSVTVTGVVVTVQLLASLTVTVYGDPAAFTVKLLLAWKAPPLSEYCNGAVPPDAVTVNVVVPPLQVIVPADADAVIAAGSVTVTGVVVTVQLLASLTVTVYGDPAAFTVKVFPPWKAPPLSEYCNAPVPPLAVTVNVVVPPLQAIVPADADAVITAGSVTVTGVVVTVQLLASLTVTV